MLLLRSVVASFIFLAIMKMDVKYYLWKSIPTRYWKDLVSRVMQGLVLMVAIYTSIKNFPLVYVSLVSNMTPLLTAVASYFLFKKGLSKLDTALLVISFIGVTLLITGSPKKEAEVDDILPSNSPSQESTSSIDILIATLLLILIPILSASVTLFISHLKSLSEITLGAYMTFSILLIYGPYIALWE